MAIRTMKTMAVIFVIGLTAMLGISGAGAQGYPGGATLTLSSPSVPQGGVLSATVAGCPPGSSVNFVLNSNSPFNMGTVIANSAGEASITVTIPTSVPVGQYTVTATCGNQTLTANVQVIAAAVTPVTTIIASGPLPITGSNTDGMVRGGIALVAVGALCVVLSLAFVRRRDAAAA